MATKFVLDQKKLLGFKILATLRPVPELAYKGQFMGAKIGKVVLPAPVAIETHGNTK